MTTQFPPVDTPPVFLDAERQYRRQLLNLPHFTEEQEQTLIERALAGEDVQNDILLSLQQRVYSTAYRLASRYLRKKEQAIERLDFVQAANLEMLKMFPVALKKENPYSYLLKVARFTMIDCLKKEQSTSQTEDEVIASAFDQTSLELLTESPGNNEVLSIQIHQALQMLPKKQRLVILRCYGFDHAPEPLNAISRSLSPKSPRPANAHYHHKKALSALKEQLTSVFPQVASGGMQ